MSACRAGSTHAREVLGGEIAYVSLRHAAKWRSQKAYADESGHDVFTVFIILLAISKHCDIVFVTDCHFELSILSTQCQCDCSIHLSNTTDGRARLPNVIACHALERFEDIMACCHVSECCVTLSSLQISLDRKPSFLA